MTPSLGRAEGNSYKTIALSLQTSKLYLQKKTAELALDVGGNIGISPLLDIGLMQTGKFVWRDWHVGCYNKKRPNCIREASPAGLVAVVPPTRRHD